jgi:phosphonate transport system permease protein
MAAAGGTVLAFTAARTFMGSPSILEVSAPPWPTRLVRLTVLWTTRMGLLTFRAIPASVWAVLAMFVLFPGVLPGAVALGIYTLGVLGRLMAEVVEGLDSRPLRALGALGASPAQTFSYGAVPQALPGFLSYSLYRWEVCSRETVIVGVVGAAGLGRVLTEQLSSFDHDGAAATLLCFVVVTLLVDLVGAQARRALQS